MVKHVETVIDLIWDMVEQFPQIRERDNQTYMSWKIAESIGKHNHLMVEAAVGIGKTYAYLIPAFLHLSDRSTSTVLISTDTLLLQDQLQHDISTLETMVHKLRPRLSLDVRLSIARGKNNYLCALEAEAQGYRDLRNWLIEEATEGTVSEYQTSSGDLGGDTLQSLRIHDGSPCHRCRFRSRCPYQIQRKRWSDPKTNMVVTNHNLLAVDLSKRMNGAPPLFRRPSVIIVDEAHQLEDAIRSIWQVTVPLSALKRDVRHASWQPRRYDLLVEPLNRFVSTLTEAIDWGRRPNRFDGESRLPIAINRRLRRMAADLEPRLARLADSHHPTIGAAADMMSMIIEPDDHIIWAVPAYRNGRVHGVYSLNGYRRSFPNTVKQVFFDKDAYRNPIRTRSDYWASTSAFQKPYSIILTSATLTTNSHKDGYDLIQSELGASDVPVLDPLDSPFDYDQNVVFYAADSETVPDPGSDDVDDSQYLDQTLPIVRFILELIGGRTLILHTAKDRARDLADRLRSFELECAIFDQYRTPNAEVRFKEDVRSVLIGTSQWQGLNVPGPSLSCVIINRLPFPVPDPIITAKQAWASSEGKKPYETVIIGTMLRKLRQGVGRLIRKEDDHGMVAILDPRFHRYHHVIMEALPFSKSPIRTLRRLQTQYEALTRMDNQC